MNTNIISGLINCTTTRNQRCTVGCPTCGALSYSNIGGKQAPFVNASGFSQCSEDRGLRRLDNLRYISRCSTKSTVLLLTQKHRLRPRRLAVRFENFRPDVKLIALESIDRRVGRDLLQYFAPPADELHCVFASR